VPPPASPLGVAAHPDFTRNGFVYLSFFAHEQPDRPRLRLIRLRQVGDTLGEPATLFEAPLRASGENSGLTGPRMAFGPGRILYLSLPAGIEFDREPAASSPVASMLRLTEDGRVPAAGPLTGVASPALGFALH